MSNRVPIKPEEMALYKEVTALTMKVARPLVWHDVRKPWPKRLVGGTCFILRFRTGLVGVTAAHVIKAFEDARKQAAKIECLLRTVPFDITGAKIAQDDTLDIVTFRVTEDQLIGSEAAAIDCTLNWPPPTPDKGRELSVAGYPNEIQMEFSYSRREFKFYVNLTRVEDINEREIVTIYDPQRDFRLRAAPELPDLGANLSGCSGGPVLMHAERNGLHRWFPVGLIVQGPRASSETAQQGWDSLRIRRIHSAKKDGSIIYSVKDDGSIQNSNVGWLPR